MAEKYMTAADIEAETLGVVSKAALAQRRFKGLPPRYLKPTAKSVLYRRVDVEAWLEGSEQSGTAQAAS